MRPTIIVFVTAFASIFCCVLSYSICGDDLHKKEEDEATDEIIKRLMGTRKPDWGWESFVIPIALQVTVPERFFGRKKTEKAVKDAVFAGSTVRSRAGHIMAFNSLCLDPRGVNGEDPVQDIANYLEKQFTNSSRSPRQGYPIFSVAMASLCMSKYPISAHLVEKLLDGQNQDGSFGDSNHLLNTVQMLSPIFCVSKMSDPSFNVTRVDLAIKKMREFVIKKIATTGAGEVYIGNKMVSSHALVSLWKTRSPGDDPVEWRCSEVAKTAGIDPDPVENERALAFRLMRLHAAAPYDVTHPGWKCVETNPIPTGYVPTCDHSLPETCLPKLEPK